MKLAGNLTVVAFAALLAAGCWMGASQHAGADDDDADDNDDNDDNDDGAASDADSDSDADTDTWSEYPSGELLGATSVKASGFYDTIWDMAAMPGGGVVVLGETSGTAKFDPGGPNETILSSDQGRLFMARYDEELGLVWARHVFVSESPSELDQARSIAVHPGGGFVVAGRFTADATFGAGQVNEVHYDEVADTDDRRLFAARFDDQGDLLWLRVTAPGSDVREPRVAAAPDGRVLLTATFGGALEFEGEPGMGTVVGSDCQPESGSLVVAAFADTGEGLWLRGEGLDSCVLRGRGVWADGAGEVAVAAESAVPFTVQVGGQAIEVQPEVAVLRYTVGGELSSATRVVTSFDQNPIGNPVHGPISAGSLSGIAGISGMADGFEVFHGGEDVCSSPEGWDGYAISLDGEQEAPWVGLFGSSWSPFVPAHVYHSSKDTSVAEDGSVLVAGDFQKDITFASADTATQLQLVTGEEDEETGNKHMYVARYAPGGVPDWAVQAGGGASCFARAVAESASGAIFVGGSFGKTAVFGAGEPGEVQLSTSGGWDVFLARYVP